MQFFLLPFEALLLPSPFPHRLRVDGGRALAELPSELGTPRELGRLLRGLHLAEVSTSASLSGVWMWVWWGVVVFFCLGEVFLG